jgi:hypothetical protein
VQSFRFMTEATTLILYGVRQVAADQRRQARSPTPAMFDQLTFDAIGPTRVCVGIRRLEVEVSSLTVVVRGR